MMIDSFSGEYRFLSNFWPAPVLLDEVLYPTVEHAYQAAKTLDTDERATIARMKTAGSAKRVGQSVTCRLDWSEVRLPTMANLLLQKFQNPTLSLLLRCTSPHHLVEGNTWGDTFWGIYKGVGENHLGRLLMEIRERL